MLFLMILARENFCSYYVKKFTKMESNGTPINHLKQASVAPFPNQLSIEVTR